MSHVTPLSGYASGRPRLAVALDLGTSGFRAQALDLDSGMVVATAITTRHPLPGANVIDHLHLALDFGVTLARELMIGAVNQLLGALAVDLAAIERLALCGNPAQLSLFQGTEIRDLAYAGTRKLAAFGTTLPERGATVRVAAEFPGLQLPGECAIIIPPAVRHEIGADALALILRSGMLDRDETAIAIDYGTNAEMALLHRGRLHTGSAAAGPALEGQHLTCGSLARPGVIADLEPLGARHRLLVLDAAMQPVPGALVDLGSPDGVVPDGTPATSITGTGTIAVVEQGLASGRIVLPRIATVDRRLHLGPGVFLTEADLAEAGKAIGAIRAGILTLAHAAGIAPVEITTAYLAGASGTYVDALKAWRVGLVPPGVRTIRQVGNTSLALARELALAPAKLADLSALARRLRDTHCLFATTKTFARVFVLELSHWTEGMPMTKYREFLGSYGLPDLPPPTVPPSVERVVARDTEDHGPHGLVMLERAGRQGTIALAGCTACLACIDQCPAGALTIAAEFSPPTITLDHARCDGVACRRCERVCPEHVFRLERFIRAGAAASTTRPLAEARS